MLLTIDIGTSTFKSALWDFDGNRLSFASVPLSVISTGGRHEVKCALWLCAFEDCCRKLGNLKSVQVIVISGNGPTLVPVLGEPAVGKEGLFFEAENARLWLERAQTSDVEKYQAKVCELMGGFVDSSFFLPKILCIKNNENKLYQKIKCFIGCPEYLAMALTGQARTVFPSDGFERWFWNISVLEKLELEPEKFPPFIRPGDPFGNINEKTAEYFGFSKDVPVIAGGPDFFAAILGSGVMKPGQICDRTGSSEGINLCTQNRIDDKRLMSYGHPVKPYWNLSGIINTSGSAIKWCRDLLGLSNFKDFFELAGMSKPGSGRLVFHPHLAGERSQFWDPCERAIWRGISIDSGRCDFANSVLEGIGFAVMDIITMMKESGAQLDELRVTGGLADCRELNQIKADITGLKVLAPVQKETELLGLAAIGACFLGKFKSFKEASNTMVRIEKHYEPNKKNESLYNSLFDMYSKTVFL
jgi:xylulokinase